MTPGEPPWPPEAAPEPAVDASDALDRLGWQPPPAKKRPGLHLFLFLLTVLTTILAGALQQGVDPWHHPELLYIGIYFSFPLLLILGAHEMGHYLVSRRHRLDVTLPFFLPAPPLIYIPFLGAVPILLGTFGAFIKIRSPIRDKRGLLDVGCAGPLIGVAVSIPVTLVGLALSRVTVMGTGPESIILGEPLLYQFLSWLVFGSLSPEANVILHPVAFAGWIGMLVTSLNLLPVGQLDGGHVSYALFPEYHRYVSLGCLGLLLVCGLAFWYGWLMWATLVAFLGWRHPPPAHYWVPLDERRKFLGFITILVFILTFSPTPIRLG